MRFLFLGSCFPDLDFLTADYTDDRGWGVFLNSDASAEPFDFAQGLESVETARRLQGKWGIADRGFRIAEWGGEKAENRKPESGDRARQGGWGQPPLPGRQGLLFG